jgi:hypothetical protein
MSNDASSLIYEERIVAFIDVLGFAKLVEQSENDPAARARIEN